jgi:hypothetical protein
LLYNLFYSSCTSSRLGSVVFLALCFQTLIIYVLPSHPQWSSGYCACHCTQGLWVETRPRTVDFYGW